MLIINLYSVVTYIQSWSLWAHIEVQVQQRGGEAVKLKAIISSKPRPKLNKHSLVPIEQ